LISYLRGDLVSVSDESAVLDVGGVGYEVLVAPVALEHLRAVEPGTEVLLLTHHYLQLEQSRGTPVLMGFRTAEERDLCLALMNVIGPRSALKALAAPVGQIAQSIELGDAAYMKSLPGIGPQKAKEIIAKLQGKVARFVGVAIEPAVAVAQHGADDPVSEAIDALVSLGHKRAEAVQAVNRALRDDPTLSSTQAIIGQVYAQR